jgi:glycosyltransferase involved in cell wall biosynthesis
VSWCAKFLASKALPIALRAIALASREILLELTIIGDGREGEPWHRLGRDLGVGGHCRWVGAVGHEEAQQMIAESDIMLLTSVQEATTTVVMEALSAGVPVLCHDTCGFGAVVDETCGIKIPLVNPKSSVRGFSEALVRLSREPELIKGLNQGAIKRAADFTWEKKAEAVTQIYARIMERSGLTCAHEMAYDVPHS